MQPSARSDQESGRTSMRPFAADDKALLERVLARDQSAMAEIFDRYSGMAYSVAMRVVKDSAQAEDVMQDVFFQVWQNPGAFVSDRGSLGAWLAVVVRNRAIDVIRRRKPTDAVEDVILPASTNVAAEVEHRTLIERVRNVMKDLPPEQRESVELAFFEGMTHAEIAQKKGEPLGTVKTRIRTALMSVRKAFQA
jgi:RNA polymerase sigma-70 factor, ECF subfamily